MPAIFNEKTKCALRARLLEIGWEHLLRKGFRALRIEDITQEAGIAWMRSVWHSERLLFRCIGVEDYRRIRRALPADAQLGPEVGSGLVGGILGDAVPRDAASDPALAMTLQRIIAMALMSRDDFDPDALERAVDVLIDVTVDVLFGTRPGTPGPGTGAATPRQA